jgi:hypothetical protein
LEENSYFEEAFKGYEKGIALFKWPNVYDIWNTYLMKFIARYVSMPNKKIISFSGQFPKNLMRQGGIFLLLL